MERQVQITKAAFKYCNPTDCLQPSAILAFIKGAEWADEHPSQKPTQEQRYIKANKAPEKIYLYPSDIPDQEYEAEWGCQPWDENSVEYTRTDVFIEKAWEFWMHKFPYIGIDVMKEFVDAMKEK